jgi:hypothetical protein
MSLETKFSLMGMPGHDLLAFVLDIATCCQIFSNGDTGNPRPPMNSPYLNSVVLTKNEQDMLWWIPSPTNFVFCLVV